MPTSIPYAPSLVLGSIVHPSTMETLLGISALLAPIDARQETLNSFIAMKRSLDMTAQELVNMGLDPKDLQGRIVDVGKQIDQAATDYARSRVEQELKLQPLRARLRLVDADLESPVDHNRSKVEMFDLASDSMSLDAQFFSFDRNDQDVANKLSSVQSYVSASTSLLGSDASFELAQSSAAQLSKQLQMHDIEGTLVITASCTHRKAPMLAPLMLDVDKAIRVWNQLFPGAQDRIQTDADAVGRIAADADQPGQKTMNIISGASLGSSFVGMVHVLRRETTESSESMESRAKDISASLQISAAVASFKGGFGLDKSSAEGLKDLLSRLDVTSHVSIITAGYIPTITANDVSLGVAQFARFDPQDMMTDLEKLNGFTAADQTSVSQSAQAARTRGQFVALKTATIESVLSGLSKIDDGSNRMLDLKSLMTAFEGYADAASGVNADAPIGLPINYYLKPVTRVQLAQMWVSKYYPGKFVAIQGDDAPVPQRKPADGQSAPQ